MAEALQEMADTYDEQGFLVAPRLFGREEAKRLKEATRAIVESVRREAADAGRNPKDVLHNGVCVGLAVRSAVFRDAVADARLLDILEVVIGRNVEFLSDKVVFKNDATVYGSPWHQDWPYWRGTHKVSVWVALDDARVANGTLKVLPGSHHEPVLHDGDASDGLGFGHRLRPDGVDEERAVTVELEAGGALFFHDLTLHASHPNVSGADRWVWIPTYRDARAVDPPYPWARAARVVRGTAGR